MADDNLSGLSKEERYALYLQLQSDSPKGPKDPELHSDLMHRLGWGGVGAITGGLTGGPVGAVAGGMAGFSAPPQDMTDVGMNIAGLGIGGAVAKLPGKGMIANAAKGLLGQELNRGAGQAMGQPTSSWNPMNRSAGENAMEAGAVALPGALAGMPQLPAIRAQQAPGQVLDRLPQTTRGKFPSAVTDPAQVPVSADLAEQQLKGPLQTLQANTQKLQAAQQATLQGKQTPYDQTKARIDLTKDNIAEQTKQVTAADTKNKQIIGKYEQHNVDLKAEIKDLDKRIKEASDDPELQAQLQAHRDQSQSTLQENQKQIIAVKTQQPGTAANDELLRANSAAAAQQREQTRLQTSLKPLEDDLNQMREHVRTNPAVDPIVQDFANSKTPDEFVQKIARANPQDVQSLMSSSHFSDTGKTALADHTRLKFFQMAFDGQSGTMKNLPSAEAAFNRDKLSAVFGAGDPKVGQVEADRYLRAFDAIPVAQQNSNNGYGKAAFKLLPGAAGVVYAMVHPTAGNIAAAAGEAAATTLLFKLPDALNKVAEDRKFGEAFQKWMSNNPSATSLKTYPVLYNWVVDQNKEKK